MFKEIDMEEIVSAYHSELKSATSFANNRLLGGALFGLLFTLLAMAQPAGAQNHLGDYRSSAGVSVAIFQNTLYMAFTGTEMSINIGTSNDGLNWSAAHTIKQANGTNQQSFDSPGLAVFNGKLWAAWTSTVSTGSHINVASSTDGTNFSDAVLSLTSAHGISLAANNGKLFLAFVPPNGEDTIAVISTTDGVNWSPETLFGFINSPSPWTPTLFNFNAATGVGFTRPKLPSDPFNRLLLGGVAGGVPVVPPNPSAGVNAGAGIGYDGAGLLYYAWVGPGGSSEEFVTTYQLQSNGSFAVISQTDMGHTGASTPCIANYNGHSFDIFPGTDSGHHINVLTLK